jgi:uncharacterized repeat protein (TIGR03943 family)
MSDKSRWLKPALLIGLGLYFAYNIVSGNLSNYVNVRFAWLTYVAAILFLLIGGRGSRWLKPALLIGLGLYFAYNIVSGNLSNYVNVRFAWLSYVAALLFLLIGASSALHLWREQREKHKNDERDAHHDHHHAPISWGALALIAVPLVFGTLIPSRPLGAEAVDGSVRVSASAGNITTFSIDPLQRNVLDWLRVFGAAGGDFSAFDGQRADLIGFVYVEPTFAPDQFMVARFTMSCCVADASAIGIPVHWAEPLPQGEWVRVQGMFRTGEFRGDPMPILQADSVEIVAQPEHPYLYP